MKARQSVSQGYDRIHGDIKRIITDAKTRPWEQNKKR